MFRIRTLSVIMEPSKNKGVVEMSGSEDYENYGTSEVYALAADKDVEGLIGVLKHNNHKHVVKRAVFALGEIKDNKAVGPLIEVGLKSELITIRGASFRALGDIGSHEAVESLVYAMLKEKEETGKIDAAQALGKIKDSRAVKPLTMLMNDEKEKLYVREEIAEVLGEIASEEAVMSLIAALDSNMTNLSEKASLVLKQIGEPALGSLISALDSESQTKKERVVIILGEIGDEKALEPLLSLLVNENEDEYFRGNYVAVALGKIKDTKAVEPLIKLASKHIEDIVTCMSVRALGDIGDSQAVEPLIAILEDRETSKCSSLRLETCWALGKIRDVRAIESLIRILGDTRSNLAAVLQAAVASALVQFDDDRIELPLLKYYKGKLDSMISSKTLAQDEKQGTLEGVVKLIARLIDKS